MFDTVISLMEYFYIHYLIVHSFIILVRQVVVSGRKILSSEKLSDMFPFTQLLRGLNPYVYLFIIFHLSQILSAESVNVKMHY